jgi:spermidine synthase
MIFLTGAAVLALEVLTSRILTPYFGVSLFIWAAILSITLTFLAVGYYGGSVVSKRLNREQLEFAYLAAPASAAATIAIGALLYPILFPLLTGANLVLGSFVGSMVLLAFPLVALSAMNPLLVALQRREGDRGDGGAGRVFFVSTIGSVAGVLTTAFVFIPLMRNYTGILLLSLVLCTLVLIYVLASRTLTKRQWVALTAGTVLTALVAGALALGQQRYLDAVSADHGFVFDIRAEYTSVFGNIKVIELKPQSPGAQPLIAFLQDGLVQNRALDDGTSVSLYTYFLESIPYAFHTEPESVLVLGLGAGIVPRNLQVDGLDVTVVEINRDALRAAQAFFGFDADAVDVRIEDARTFVRHCGRTFDVAIVDLFHGDNTPDYLMTREFFADLSECMDDQSVLVINAFFDSEDETPNQRVRATIHSVFPSLFEYRSPDGAAYLAATKVDIGAPDALKPVKLPAFLRQGFAAAANVRRIDSASIQDAVPISDAHNVFKVIFSTADRRLRRNLADGLPVQFLVN